MDPALKQAAVVLILYPRDGRPWALFMRRTERVADHKGQISLPGGSRDPEDSSLLATALREALEELNVDPASLVVVGRLKPVYTVVTHYVITPYVAYTPTRPDVRPEEFEVAEVLDVPLDRLLEPSVVRAEQWDSHGVSRPVYFFDWNEGKDVIWGATGRIIKQFADTWSEDWWRRLVDGEMPALLEDDGSATTDQHPTAV